ncbi:hypothetical protein AOQ84DRAFT_386729 [Glonium stellatum]|uniref:Transmembrane protein n=1 Tax=Glonium stellatum TaxID=574774 RepID=A0A8E2F749_9PEZI|nr:hypothetical protein AOQ84DRAFT_386729 [Glonium stellatum]
MKDIERFCSTLDYSSHADPVDAIWAQVYPWFGVWLCSLSTVFFASDFIHHAILRAIEQKFNSYSALRYSSSSRPTTSANNVIAFILASLGLVANSFWFVQAVANYLIKFYCVADPHWEDSTDLWANIGIFLASPLLIAIVAWLKTVVNLFLAHWNRHLSDVHWHPFLGLHLILWALMLPLAIVILVPFSLVMLCMGRSLNDVKGKMRDALQWIDINIRRDQVQTFPSSIQHERNIAERFSSSDEEQPLLTPSESHVPRYDGSVSEPSPYAAKRRA